MSTRRSRTSVAAALGDASIHEIEAAFAALEEPQCAGSIQATESENEDEDEVREIEEEGEGEEEEEEEKEEVRRKEKDKSKGAVGEEAESEDEVEVEAKGAAEERAASEDEDEDEDEDEVAEVIDAAPQTVPEVLSCVCELAEDEEMVCCDGCSRWHHYKCANLNEADVTRLNMSEKQWFCWACAPELHTSARGENPSAYRCRAGEAYDAVEKQALFVCVRRLAPRDGTSAFWQKVSDALRDDFRIIRPYTSTKSQWQRYGGVETGFDESTATFVSGAARSALVRGANKTGVGSTIIHFASSPTPASPKVSTSLKRKAVDVGSGRASKRVSPEPASDDIPELDADDSFGDIGPEPASEPVEMATSEPQQLTASEPLELANYESMGLTDYDIFQRTGYEPFERDISEPFQWDTSEPLEPAASEPLELIAFESREPTTASSWNMDDIFDFNAASAPAAENEVEEVLESQAKPRNIEILESQSEPRDIEYETELKRVQFENEVHAREYVAAARAAGIEGQELHLQSLPGVPLRYRVLKADEMTMLLEYAEAYISIQAPNSPYDRDHHIKVFMMLHRVVDGVLYLT